MIIYSIYKLYTVFVMFICFKCWLNLPYPVRIIKYVAARVCVVYVEFPSHVVQ